MLMRRRGMAARVIKPLLAVLLMAGVFSLVMLRSKIYSLEYGIALLERQRDEALVHKASLDAELASLRSIGEVEARGLGLGFPDRERVFYVKVDEPEAPETVGFRPR